MKKDDKIIDFNKKSNDNVTLFVIATIASDDDSTSGTANNSEPEPDFNVKPEPEIIDVEFDDDAPDNPLSKLLSFAVKGLNKSFYMDKSEVKVKKKPKRKKPQRVGVSEARADEPQPKKSSIYETITNQIVDENKIYILEELLQENDLEKLKMLFHGNDKLKNWIKNNYPIYRLSKEVLDIIDGKEV